MQIQSEQPATGRYERWPHRGAWERDCPGQLLLSSADRNWSGLSAELCTARKGVIPWRTPRADIRICVATRSSQTVVTRQAPGIESQIVAGHGTVWLSPPGLRTGLVDFDQNLPEFLHIHLPVNHFSSSTSDTETDKSAGGDRSLVDIALSLSFSSQANFTRAFKQATGQAPGRYRQAAARIHSQSL